MPLFLFLFSLKGFTQANASDSINAALKRQEIVWQKRKELSVTDRSGIPLNFPEDNITYILNFFYYNGWKLALVNDPQSSKMFLLEKIKGR